MAGLWGKTDKTDELVLQRYDAKSGTWKFVQVVQLNGASRICRNIARETGTRHRVFNTGKQRVHCECG